MREPAGLVLAPFRGVRYAPERVSGLAEVTCPPYDVVGAAAAERLRDSDPHNVVRLTLPTADDAGGAAYGRYRAAGRTLRRWIAEGVLVPDGAAALYIYEERAGRAGEQHGDRVQGGGVQRGGVQRGLIGAIELAPPAAGIVLPHEDVTAEVVADRRQLMEATGANLEPIFLLYNGGGAATALVAEVAQNRTPLIEASAGGVTHRLWTVTGPAQVATVAADLAHRNAMIADGHHRYAAYLELQARRHAEGSGRGPWDYGLALLVDSLAYPPRIAPIHRAIPGLTAEVAVRMARSAFTVRQLPPGTSLAAAREQLRAAGRAAAAVADPASARASGSRVAFLLAADGVFHLLTDPDPVRLAAVTPSGRSDRWRWLDMSVLNELLIRDVWQVRDEASVRIVHEDAEAAVGAALPGGTAVICNAPHVSDVLAVAAGGERMPQKSTSFGPKPRTGLVMRSFAYG